jgi:hypothetical protein
LDVGHWSSFGVGGELLGCDRLVAAVTERLASGLFTVAEMLGLGYFLAHFDLLLG